MKFFKPRTIIIAFSFLLTSIVLIIDNQPQRFPLPEGVETPDCMNIDIINISIDINRIHFSMRARSPFIEFPIEASSHLIKINAETSTAHFTYFYSDFWDFNATYVKQNEMNENDFDFLDFNFNILQTINGNVSLSVFCSNLKLEKEEFEINENENHSKFVSLFNFSIDKVVYYPIVYSKIEFIEMNTVKISGFSIFNSNLVYHTRNIVDFKPLKIGKRNFNITIDYRNFMQFCDGSNQSFYNDEVFIVSSESLNELNSSFFFSNCILRIFFSILKINKEIDEIMKFNGNSSLVDELLNDAEIDKNINVNTVNSNLDLASNKTENLTEKVSFKIKLLIIDDHLNNDNKSIPISEAKYQSFESLFGHDSIEIINMNEKKCFREGILFDFENNFNENEFLSKINDNSFNISSIRNMFLLRNESLSLDPIKNLVDSEIISSSKYYDLLNVSDNINEVVKKVYLSNKFIVTRIENLPFALFMNEGAKLVQIGGNKLIGQKIASLSRLENFTYCENSTYCDF